MSAESLLKNEAQATTAEDQGLLSKVVAATRQTEPDRAQNLLRTLTDQALKGTVKYDRNLTVTLNHAIAELDRTISEQIAAIMQAPESSPSSKAPGAGSTISSRIPRRASTSKSAS